MRAILSRREFAGGVFAAGVLSALPAAAAAPADSKRLVAGPRVLDVHCRAAKVFALTGPDGRSGLSLAPGERFQVEFTNTAGANPVVNRPGQLPQ